MISQTDSSLDLWASQKSREQSMQCSVWYDFGSLSRLLCLARFPVAIWRQIKQGFMLMVVNCRYSGVRQEELWESKFFFKKNTRGPLQKHITVYIPVLVKVAWVMQFRRGVYRGMDAYQSVHFRGHTFSIENTCEAERLMHQ